MSEPLAWARWWFYPWNHAHDGWEEPKSVRVDALCRAEHVRASIALNITPSPPPPLISRFFDWRLPPTSNCSRCWHYWDIFVTAPSMGL